jgi:putative flippase GtrA
MTRDELGKLIECLFEKHKFVRRFLVGWSATIITLATYAIFKEPTTITAASATALATVTGILTVVIGFYQWDRTKDGEK